MVNGVNEDAESSVEEKEVNVPRVENENSIAGSYGLTSSSWTNRGPTALDNADEDLEIKSSPTKRKTPPAQSEEDEDDEEPIRKRSRRGRPSKTGTAALTKEERSKKAPKVKLVQSTSKKVERQSATITEGVEGKDAAREEQSPTVNDQAERSESEDEVNEEDAEEEPETVKKAREKVQSTLKSSDKDPYPDWKPGEPVPYAALCTTFSLIEMTTKRLQILSHCSLFLRQVLRLTPDDLLPTIHLMINKLAADYAGIELGIGESLIMKAIGEATGRNSKAIKDDQSEIGDLGLVAAKSRSTQPTMFKPKPLTIRSVFNSLMGIATVQGSGAQQRKVDGIKKLLSAADVAHAGTGSKGIDITKDKGGPSEAKYIIRALEGKLRLGLAEKTVPVALAQAIVIHETEKKSGKAPSSEKLAQGEEIIKTVYR